MKKTDKKLDVLNLKRENKLLTVETKDMEEKLKLLKSALYSELRKTNKSSSSAPIWEGSSSTSTTSKQGPDALVDVSRLKFKTLKYNSASEIKSLDTYGSNIRKSNKQVKHAHVNPANTEQFMCGQCESKKAVVLCQECSEYYCVKCFATFHLKGALRRHHSLPISTHSFRPELHHCKNTGDINQIPGGNEVVNKECQNSFNTATKSNSALQTEAITGIDHHDPLAETSLSSTKSSATSSHSTSTMNKTSVPIEIYFTPSITYAEKLLLRLYRNSKLQQSIRKESISNQTVCERMFLLNPNIEEEERNQKETMENCTVNRVSFDELHKLATTQIQLSKNNTRVFSHSKLNSERPISQCDKITYSTIDELNEHHPGIPLFNETLYNLAKQRKNTERTHKEQCSQIIDGDHFVENIDENNKVMGLLNGKQNIWQPAQSLINPDSDKKYSSQ
ncbi:unnamed protein product [Schistosoma turkestanicum]|nr:unnamed protein product [Schistosoma turkestanicum]